ncbi:DNA-binding domain-containing protein [Polycladidibacter hongkongensis]|uniref:HvfC/BufC N-terminal domain-containing protein n=1 Tax=Polycladidibacter hongkongensis TaxID=1647556 RepID=UPI000834E5F4|nr:DNA-binding domain-containing protein [Pseudovibrio hongkongensis]
MPRPTVHSRFAAALLEEVSAVPSGVVGRNGQISARRFGVYRNNVMASLIDALASNFPMVAQLLGAEFFRAMAAEFVRGEPPRQPVLSEYGERLPAFMSGFPPLAEYSYIADVARLEWAWLQAYHSADWPVLQSEKLAALAPEKLMGAKLSFLPSCRLVELRYEVAAICFGSGGHDCAVAELDARAGDAGKVNDRSQFCVLARPQLHVRCAVVDEGTYFFLRQLKRGNSLSQAGEAALATFKGFDLSASLTAGLQSGAVSDVHEG